MSVLPQSACLVSYLVVTLVMCAITYVLVLNLQHLKGAINFARSSVHSTLRTRGAGDSESKEGDPRNSSLVGKRASTMA